MLRDARVGAHRLRRLRASHAMQESGGREPVKRLADVELAVDQPDERLLLRGETRVTLLQPRAVDFEDEVEARDLLLDQAPFVDAPRTFEQERFRIDRDEEVLGVRGNVGLEVERSLV